MGDECDRCRGVRTRPQIRSLEELEAVIETIRDDLSKGVLVEVPPPTVLPWAPPSVMDLELGGPWPDALQYDLSCAACGCVFRLGAETYRGVGGVWDRLEALRRRTAVAPQPGLPIMRDLQSLWRRR
jgi:hypothetical protein